MTARPFWRRMAPTSTAARLTAVLTLICFVLLIYALIYAPLQARLADARDRAASLDRRAAALTAAAEALKAEATVTAPDEATLMKANAWLDEHAPVRADGDAALDLLSTLRLIAQASEVNLASVAPLDAARDAAARDLAATAELAGLRAHVAEARIAADHAGLARFLSALEATRPTLRAASLEVTARSTSAAAEDGRLSVLVVVAALSRPAGG